MLHEERVWGTAKNEVAPPSVPSPKALYAKAEIPTISIFCQFLVDSSLTNFCAPFFKEIPFFFPRGDPLQNPRRTPAPEYCISSRKWRSFEVRGRGGIQEGRGRWGGGKKKEKRTRKKCSGSCLLTVEVFLLSVHPFLLTVVGTVSKKDQAQFPDGGNRKYKRTKPIVHRKQERPNRISTVSTK